MDRLTLLVLDDYEGELAKAPAMAQLRQLADVTILSHPLSAADQPLLAEADVLFALRERTKMDAAFFDQCPNLKLILQSGGHAYHLDRAAATARGIVVALGRRVTMPPVVVPELVFGLMLGLVRQIYPLHRAMAMGEWPVPVGGALHGRTLGLLGYGRHGRPVARLAAAFGMKVVAWARDAKQAGAVDEFGVMRLPLAELLATADIVSIHLRLSDESRGLLNHERLAQMKEGAYLINTSRGAIVDESALIEALQRGHLAGAGLDVFAIEPLAPTSPLRSLPNVLLTPHIGWKVADVLHEFVQIAAEQLAQWQQGELPEEEILNPEALAGNKDTRRVIS